MGAITSTNVATAIVKLVAADALPALMGNLVMGNLVNRDYEPALAQAGDTINVPIPPTLVANNIAEGGTVTLQNPNLGNAQIVLNTHAEATFQIPDVTKVLAVPDLLKLYMQPAVVAMAESIETEPAEAVCRRSRPILRWARAGRRSRKRRWTRRRRRCSRRRFRRARRSTWWWIRTTYSALRQIPRFSEFNTAGEAGLRALVDGAVGKMKDFYIFRSQFVAHDGEQSGDDAQPGVRAGRDRAWWCAGCRSRCRERARSRSTRSWATSACG